MSSKLWKWAFQIGYNIYCTSLGSYYFNRQLKDGRLKFPQGHSICIPLEIDSLQIIPVPYAYDNYAYIIHSKAHPYCAVIDPGAAEEVTAKLKEHGLHLVLILITHKHWDHSAGVAALVNEYKNVHVMGWKTERPESLTLPQENDEAIVSVFKVKEANDKIDVVVSALKQKYLPQEDGSVSVSYQVIPSNKKFNSKAEISNERKSSCYHSCLPCGVVSTKPQHESENNSFLVEVNKEDILFSFRVYHTPGHTHGHCVYQLLLPESCDPRTAPIIFSGDLIFLGGMGRVLEGTLEEQMQSISKILAEFPTNTNIFPGHEYALSNLVFVEKELECEDPALREKLNWCIKRRRKNLPTFPSTIEEELGYNPFLKLAYSTIEEHHRI